MKTKKLFLLALFVAMTTGAFAIVRTVSNNTNSPGQYTSIQAAVDASGLNGDTIMVAGSPTSYGNVTIAKKIVLVGAGWHNPYGYNTIVDNIYLQRSNDFVNSAGTKIMGIYVVSWVYYSPFSGGGFFAPTNILIERCYLNVVGFTGYGGNTLVYNNDTIRNCFIAGYINIEYAYYTSNYGTGGIHIHNNFFNGAYLTGGGANQNYIYIRNNIFVNRAAAVFNSNVYNWVIENNIFYNAYPTGASGSAFTKNIGYMCPDMPGAGNIGSGNMNSTNPQFVNYPLLGGAFSWSYDFHLQATSPGKNAGTDLTDIGIYGGMLPMEIGVNPHFPQMMTLTLPSGSSVPAGGTLNVHFTAKKQN
jgi:hypothetical protein